MDQIINALDVFWKVFPDVWLDALIVYVAVAALKAIGVIKQDTQAQLGNLTVAFLLSGGKVPNGEFQTVSLAMTSVVAGLYYHVVIRLYPVVRDFLVSLKNKQ